VYAALKLLVYEALIYLHSAPELCPLAQIHLKQLVYEASSCYVLGLQLLAHDALSYLHSAYELCPRALPSAWNKRAELGSRVKVA
jgi:hypothetical protein